MANNLQSVTLPNGVWVNIYTVTGIAPGNKLAVQNIGSSDVYLQTSFVQPDKDSDSFQVIQANDFPMTNESGSQGEWAFSPNQDAKIQVRIVN